MTITVEIVVEIIVTILKKNETLAHWASIEHLPYIVIVINSQ